MKPFKIRFVALVTTILVSTALSTPAQISKPAAAPNDLDEFAARVLKEFEVPGLAVAIVKDGKVVLAKGYGVRKLGDPAPVDENTLFAIGSCSKAFTAAALAILVDEGKIAWDDPVTKYLKDFRMADAMANREITVKDLLSHHSGLPAYGGDAVWY